MKNKFGFTLIELLIFIVLLGIIGTTILAPYVNVLRRSPVINQQIDAIKAAAQCMDWYLGQRFIAGFTSSTLNCGNTIPTFCTALPEYNLSTNIACSTYYGDPANYKTITVKVSGAGNATLSTIITNY